MRNQKSTPTNFQIVFPMLPVGNSLADSKELSLHIFGTVVPGVSIEPIESSWQGMAESIGGSAVFEDWTLSFVVDEDLYNWFLLYSWVMKICNKKDNPAGNVKDYKIDATVKIVDNFNNNILRVKYIDVWPKALGAVNFSYREGQSLLESDLTLNITRYEVERI